MAERGQGFKYQLSVTAYLASLLSKNETVKDYHIFYERDEVAPFDDIVVAVSYKNSDDFYLYLIQVKSGKGKVDVKKYLDGYNKIIQNRLWGSLKISDKIIRENIQFWYITSKSITRDIIAFTEDPVTINLNITKHICNNNEPILSTNAYCIYSTDENVMTRYKQFFSKFYILLDQPGTKSIANKLKGIWSLNDPSHVIEYLDKYFTKNRKGSLRKTVFEHELLRIRFSNYIVTPTKVLPFRKKSANAWNNLTLSNDITIVQNEFDIETYLFGCILQILSSIISIDQWNNFANNEGKLDSDVKSKFTSTSLKPETLKDLVIYFWIQGKIPLILKADNLLPVLKEFYHLKQHYIIIDSDPSKRYNEMKSYNLSVIKDLQDVNENHELLHSILISIQGRKPISLHTIINCDKRLMETLTCSDIIKLMKPRKAYLNRECLEGNNYMLFIIETTNPELQRCENCMPIGDNIFIYCQPSESDEYYQRVKQDLKFRSYKIYRLYLKDNRLLINKRKLYEIQNDDAKKPYKDNLDDGLKYFFIDEYGESVYRIDEDNAIPIIGEIMNTTCSKYVSRYLRKCIIVQKRNRSLLDDKNTDSIIEYTGPLFSEDDFLEQMTGKICVVVGEPGMGKTTLLHSLFRNCEPQYYVLFCDLIRYQVDMYDNNQKSFEDPINFLCSKHKFLPYNNFLTELCRDQKRVILILDSFDEVIGTCKEQVLKLIMTLNENTCLYKIIIASRLLTVNLLSDQFNVHIAKIEGFSNSHNDDYIENWGFDSNTLRGMPEEFLVTPLYLNILRTISENEVNLKILNRWTLYKSIVDLKMKLFCRRTNAHILDDGEKEIILMYHWKSALKVIFGKNKVTRKLCRKKQAKFPNSARLGMITCYDENDEPIFVHHTFAEFFVAQWLIENTEEDDAKYIYNEMLDNRTFNILDIHCEQFSLHKAVMDGNLIQVQKLCKENKDLLMQTDGIGRTALHIAAIYCNLTFVPDIKLLETIIQYMREEGYCLYLRDTLLNWTWTDYCRQNSQFNIDVLFNESVIIQEAYWDYYASEVKNLNSYSLHCCKSSYFNERYNNAVKIPSFSIIHDLLLLKYYDNNDFVNFRNLCLCSEITAVTLPKYFELSELGLTPLHLCCIYANINVLAACVKNGHNINATDVFGYTPLYYSVCNQKRNIVELLLAEGADARLQPNGKIYINIFQMSLKIKNKNITKMLVEKIEVDRRGKLGLTSLHDAIKFGDIQVVEMLLKVNANLNIADNRGDTPLHYAIKAQRKDMVQLFVQGQVNVNATNDDLLTPLFLAAKNNDIEIINILLQQNANVNIVAEGTAPLNLAIKAQRKDIVDILLKYEPNLNIDTSSDGTPLYCAVRKGNVEIVEILLQNGANVNYVNERGLISFCTSAIKETDKYPIQVLVNYLTDMNFKDTCSATPLFEAIKTSNLNIVELLLRNGADLHITNKFGFTPLLAAVETENVDMVKIFLENGADVNFKTECDLTPLYLAALKRNADIIRLLFKYGAHVNIITSASVLLAKAKKNGNLYAALWLLEFCTMHSPSLTYDLAYPKKIVELIQTVEKQVDINLLNEIDITRETSNNELINVLLRYKTDLVSPNRMKYLNTVLELRNKDVDQFCIRIFMAENNANIKRYTAVGYAAKEQNNAMVEILLRNGVDANSVNEVGRTPLLTILEDTTDKSIIEILLEYQADVNFTDKSGVTPLLAAIRSREVDIVKMLIDKKSIINYASKDNLTPLIAAIARGDLTIIQTLLDNDADVNFTDECGLTPLYMAALIGDFNIVQMLLRYGANTNIEISGNKLLFQAIESGNARIINLLLFETCLADRFNRITEKNIIVKKVFYNRANVNVVNESDSAPLHLAIEARNVEMVEILLGFGANPNQTDAHGRTALHLAVKINNEDIVQELLNSKAYVNVLDNNGLTPLDYANANKNVGIVYMLKY